MHAAIDTDDIHNSCLPYMATPDSDLTMLASYSEMKTRTTSRLSGGLRKTWWGSLSNRLLPVDQIDLQRSRYEATETQASKVACRTSKTK